MKKASLPENTLFYINQAYQSFKDGKKNYYNSPDNADSSSTKRNRKLEIEYCVALVTVRNDLKEQFFLTTAIIKKTLRCFIQPENWRFQAAFGQHKLQYEGGAFDEQKISKLSSYLPATVERKEKINKYLASVHFKPFHVDFAAVFGEKFKHADPNFDRAAVVSYMNKVAQQSSQNLKRNADAFLSTVSHDNGKLLWPGGKRTLNDKFALIY